LADVAVHAGVSRSLASLVMRQSPGPSAASREAVQRAAAELAYQPDLTAKLLRQQRSRMLGVVFDPGDPFHADLLEALYPAAEDCSYEILLGARVPTRGEGRAVDGLLRSRCEGLVLIGSGAPGAELRGIGERVPVVVVGRRGRDAGVDAVLGADDTGAAAAVDMLVGTGHGHIRMIDGGRRPGAAERRRGYRAAMRRHGLEPDVVAGDHTEESGARAAQDLLHRREGVTAVLAGNDRCAIGLLVTLLRAGVRVPEQISVVGYDDTRLARNASVNLTTVAQDTTGMARLIMETLTHRLDGDGDQPRQDHLVEPRLVVRASSGPPAQAATPRTS
jgi:DNA-binding LacI/PurR family transcriptional regulator